MRSKTARHRGSIPTTFAATVVAGAVVAGAVGRSGAASAEVISADHVKAMVEQGEILSLQEILQINGKTLSGRIVSIELEREKGRLVYELRVLPPKGRYKKIEIDAVSGEIVRRQ